MIYVNHLAIKMRPYYWGGKFIYIPYSHYLIFKQIK